MSLLELGNFLCFKSGVAFDLRHLVVFIHPNISLKCIGNDGQRRNCKSQDIGFFSLIIFLSPDRNSVNLKATLFNNISLTMTSFQTEKLLLHLV